LNSTFNINLNSFYCHQLRKSGFYDDPNEERLNDKKYKNEERENYNMANLQMRSISKLPK
jgi:hypothetical protein